MKAIKPLILFLTLIVVACGNPELEKHKSQLELAIADKDYFAIIKHASRVLEIDNENVEAIAAFRDSARVYSHIRDAAESLRQLNEKGIDDIDFFNMETPNDDLKFVEMMSSFYGAVISSEEMPEDWIKELNSYVGGHPEESAPTGLAVSTKAAFVKLEISNAYETLLEGYKDQIDHLIDAKKSLAKAERLDPRFRGVMDLEEIIDQRAEIFTLITHFYITSPLMETTSEAAEHFNELYAATNAQWDEFTALGSYNPFGIGDAYSMAKSEITTKDATRKYIFEQTSDNAVILSSIYKDLEDEFEDIDSLEPAIELVKNMIEVLRLTEAEGSLSDWNKSMNSVQQAYLRASRELNSEIEPIEDLEKDKTELDGAIDIILDKEIISALESSVYI